MRRTLLHSARHLYAQKSLLPFALPPLRTMASTAQPPASASLRTLRPPSYPGMMELDRSKFNLTIPVVTARVPAATVGAVLKNPMLRGYVHFLLSILDSTIRFSPMICKMSEADRRQLVDIPKTKSVLVNPNEPESRKVLLRVSTPDELPEQTRVYLNEIGAKLGSYDVELDYSYWSARESDCILALLSWALSWTREGRLREGIEAV